MPVSGGGNSDGSKLVQLPQKSLGHNSLFQILRVDQSERIYEVTRMWFTVCPENQNSQIAAWNFLQ